MIPGIGTQALTCLICCCAIKYVWSVSRLSLQSNCSNSFKNESSGYASISKHYSHSILNLSDAVTTTGDGSVSLKVINVGFGSTGTRSLFIDAIDSAAPVDEPRTINNSSTVGDSSIPSRFRRRRRKIRHSSRNNSLVTGVTEQLRKFCHWRICEPKGFVNGINEHFYTLQMCVINQPKLQGQRRCRIKEWLTKLKYVIIEAVTISDDNDTKSTTTATGRAQRISGLEYLSDTPAYYLLDELLSIAPNLVVQHTLRDPYEWVISRVARHPHEAKLGGDVICNPTNASTYPITYPRTHNNSSKPASAFHILSCLNNGMLAGSEYVYEALISLRQYLQLDAATALQYLGDERAMRAIRARSINAKEADGANAALQGLAAVRHHNHQYQYQQQQQQQQQHEYSNSNSNSKNPMGKTPIPAPTSALHHKLIREVVMNVQNYNQYVKSIVLPDNYYPICLWDKAHSAMFEKIK